MNRPFQHVLAGWATVLLGLCVAGCASAQPKKLQTYEELFLKLKEGFYSGRLIEPDFYSKELGYPLMAPLRFLPENVQDREREQIIQLSGGELRDEWLVVVSQSDITGRKSVITDFRKISAGEPCLKVSDFVLLWGLGKLQTGRDPAYHRRVPHGVKYVPGIYWQSEFMSGQMEMNARFVFSGETTCLATATFVVRKIKE